MPIDNLDLLLIVCPLVFLGSFVDAIAGGGGLITLPAYLLAGVPPHVALATNKLSSSIGMCVSTARLYRNGFINCKMAVFPIGGALIGSWLGAQLALQVPAETFQIILVCCLPVVAFLVLRKKTFSPDTRAMPTSQRLIILCGCGFVCGIYDGFYGPGSGTFLLLSISMFGGLGLKDAAGQMRITNFSSGLAALATFAFAGEINWFLGCIAGLFGIAGHYLGAGLVLDNGEKIVRPVILIVLVCLLLKTVADYWSM